LLEAANYTRARNNCKIFVVGQCSFLQGEDYYAAMEAQAASDVALIKREIEKMFGSDHQSKFNRAIDDAVVQVYGESLLYSAQFREAVPVFQTELEIRLRRGDDEATVASTYLQLGRASDALGNYAEALRYYGEALQLYIRCHGTGHVAVATTYRNIGVVHRRLGNLQLALEYYEKDLAITKAALGGGHVNVAMTYGNMGCVYEKLGKFEKALEMHEKDLEIKLKTVGQGHENVATSHYNI